MEYSYRFPVWPMISSSSVGVVGVSSSSLCFSAMNFAASGVTVSVEVFMVWGCGDRRRVGGETSRRHFC